MASYDIQAQESADPGQLRVSKWQQGPLDEQLPCGPLALSWKAQAPPVTPIARREYRSVAVHGPWAGADVYVYPDATPPAWHVEIIGHRLDSGEPFSWDQFADNDEDLTTVLEDLGIADAIT